MYMKTILSALMLSAVTTAMAQDINLPKPNFKQSSMSVVEALQTRHSVRDFTEQELTIQQISNLCWAACGVSRDNDHRTAPTSMNKKEIRLFVFIKGGTYEYLPVENKLVKKADGDNRALLGNTQPFVKDVPVVLLTVIDFEKYGNDNQRAMKTGCVDAGIVTQNINLYCQSVGLATVPRAQMDIDGISKLLGFTDKQIPVMNNPVGFEKK